MLGGIRDLADEAGVPHNLGSSIPTRQGASGREAFLGAYADDLLLGHTSDEAVRALFGALPIHGS